MTVYPIATKNNKNNYIPQILLFVLLACLLPLVCILLMNTPLGQMSTVNLILFGIEAASPTLAAIITVSCFEKKSGVKAFFRFNFSPQLKAISVIFCITIAFAIMVTAKTVSCLLLNASFEVDTPTSKQILIIAWAFIAEEIGWRGLLTKKLSAFCNKALVPLFTGLIWAFWHYHFFIIGTIDVAVPLFIIGCIADSYLYSSLLKISKGNIIIAMVFHMTSNFFISLFLINPNVNGGSSVPYAAYVVITAIAAIVIATALKGRSHNNRASA